MDMKVSTYLPDIAMPKRCAAQNWLKGQRALVTGASSGIGREIALALGAYGADVVVNFVSGEATAQQTAADIRKTGNRAIAVKADVSKEEEVQAMFRRMYEEFGTIDILVNNAGLQQDARVRGFDARAMEQGHRRQSHWPVPVLARGGA